MMRGQGMGVKVLSVALLLLTCVPACRRVVRLPRFAPDPRLQRVVPFDALSVSVALARPGAYVRFDGFVPDLDTHQAAVLREYALTGAGSFFTNAATGARTMRIGFRDGERCDVVFARRGDNEAVSKAALEHEKYHVVAHLAPDRLVDLERALDAKGFPVALRTFDEESAASIVEVAPLHLFGIPLQNISGSELVTRATAALSGARARAPRSP
jgi:hypothetical protein